MPTYLYECPVHNTFECEHSIKEELTVCPKCVEEKLPSQTVKRLISGGTGFILAGSGWAKEGYSK